MAAPAAIFAHVVVLGDGDLGEAGLQDGGEQVVVAGDLFHDAGVVVGDVAEVAADLLGHYQRLPVGDGGEGSLQWHDSGFELHEFAFELVDLFDAEVRVAAEHRRLDGVQVGLHRRGDLDVAVDDPVVDGVHDRPRALGQQLRCGFEVGAD